MRRIKRQSDGKTSQASAEQSMKLEFLLNLINGLPDSREERDKINPHLTLKKEAGDHKDIYEKLVLKSIENCSPDVKDYVLTGWTPWMFEQGPIELGPSMPRLGTPIERYEDIWSAKAYLEVIADIFAQRVPQTEEFLLIRPFKPQQNLPARITKNGDLFIERHWMSSLFEEEIKEAFRIRKCVICEKVFWAKRKDLKACPKPRTCSNMGTTRRWREKTTQKQRDLYKYQRAKKKK